MQTLVQWAIAATGLGLAIFLGTKIADANYQAIMLIIAVTVGCVFYFGFSAYLWMVCVGALFIPGSLTFLPLGLKLFEVMLIAGAAHFFLEKTVFKKIYPSFGPQPAGTWLLLTLAVVVFHGVSDRFGVRMLGGDTWGGRAYLGIIVSGIAYYFIQSMQLSISRWRSLPMVIIIIASVDLVVKLVSFYVPAFDSAVSAFYSGTFGYNPALEVSRWGFLGDFGYVLVTAALAYSTLPGMITRGAIIPPLFLLSGAVLCLSSGYRSSMLFLFCLLLIGSARDLRAKTLFVFPILITGLLALSWIHSSVYSLPQGIQRGLVWIPGEWDENLRLDAEGSDDFRWKVWAYWAENKFPDAPFFGRGLGVPYEEILGNLDEAMAIDPGTGETVTKFADRERSFTVTGNLHNGFLSVIDRFGIVGAFCFFAFVATSFATIIKVMYRTPVNYKNCSIHWLGVYICAYILAYPIGALRIDDFFAPTVLLIGIFNALVADYKRTKVANTADRRFVPVPAQEPVQGVPAPSVASV